MRRNLPAIEVFLLRARRIRLRASYIPLERPFPGPQGSMSQTPFGRAHRRDRSTSPNPIQKLPGSCAVRPVRVRKDAGGRASSGCRLHSCLTTSTVDAALGRLGRQPIFSVKPAGVGTCDRSAGRRFLLRRRSGLERTSTKPIAPIVAAARLLRRSSPSSLQDTNEVE